MSRIKTLHPTINNISDEQIPIPIETAYFLEDGERDPTKPNRYWFNFPPEWSTSNRGESIVGVRNIYTIARRRKLEFDLSIRKYLRSAFDELKAKTENKNKTNDEIYDMIPDYKKSMVSYNIISWLGTEHDLREIFSDLHREIQKPFKIFNDYYAIERDAMKKKAEAEIDALSNELSRLIAEWDDETNITTKFEKRRVIDQKSKELNEKMAYLYREVRPIFVQDEDPRTRDVQMDGYYDYNRQVFIEKIFSNANDEKTKDTSDYIFNTDIYDYYIDFKIEFLPRPYDKSTNKQDNSFNQIYDFVDIMNVGKEPFQNDPEKYMDMTKPILDKNGNILCYQGKWMREITFENVWDRHSCKVFASFATDSSKGYLGNSQVFYPVIKYFKLNSTDQQFWIEFYSGRHNNVPVIVPISDSFNIEMLFLANEKMFYT